MTRYIRVGKVSRKVRPPTTVRPPTSVKQATVSAFSAGYTSVSDTDVDYPTYVAGDIMIICQYAGGFLPSNPTGYTSIADQSDGLSNTHIRLSARIMNGTEGSATPALDYVTAVTICRISPNGATITISDIDATIGSTQPASTTTPNPPSHTPGGGADTYIVLAGMGQTAGSGAGVAVSAPPSGYTFGITQLGANFGSPSCSMTYATVDITTAEDPGTLTVTGGASSGGATHPWTLAVLAGAGTAEVAAGDHTHDASTLTDIAAATAKGQLLVSDGDSWETLTVGSNDQHLIADSGEALGVKWGAGSTVAALDDLTDVDTTTTSPTSGDLLEYDGTNFVPSSGYTKELLMQDGVTNPPVPIENEAQDDWLYQD